MNILIDITHPAKVHQFRNAAKIFSKRGHHVIIVARDKDVLVPLLTLYGFQFEVLTKTHSGVVSTILEILVRDLKIAWLVKKHNIDVMLGAGSSIPHVSKVTRAKSIVFATDDANIMKTFAKLSYPVADVVATPACLTSGFGQNHIRYESYHQLAYLHPNRFTPDPNIHSVLGVQRDKPYFILRFVAMEANHDLGHKGLSIKMRKQLVNELSKRGRVFITSEKTLPDELQPYQVHISPDKIHDALYYATMFIGDSQSMTMEAAVLGTPAIRCNTFVGKIAVLEEMEHKYGLAYGFLPDDEEKMFKTVIDLLDDEKLQPKWQEKRAKMLGDKVDLTTWMVDFVESYMQNEKTFML